MAIINKLKIAQVSQVIVQKVSGHFAKGYFTKTISLKPFY